MRQSSGEGAGKQPPIRLRFLEIGGALVAISGPCFPFVEFFAGWF
jgi:hypothetical protein